MSERFPGGIITKSPATPTGPYQTGAAPGIWTLDQQLQYQQQGIWPTAGLSPNYIEDVFSTWLYTGTGAAQTITNGIDLSTKGGLVWTKSRTYGNNGGTPGDHVLWDSSVQSALNSNTTYSASGGNQNATTGGVFAFYNNGFLTNQGFSGANFATWTFRKQPKFFDVVTYTGTGSNTTIAHNLGSVPGCIIVKRTDTTGAWQVYHRSLANTEYLVLNTTAATATGTTRWNSTTPTSTVFSLGTDASVNASGGTYVAYIYAHNSGGFGLTGTDNVITCGSFTTDASGAASVNLGYEPQFWLYKPTIAARYWTIYDVMRGWSQTYIANLNPNVADAEGGGAATLFYPTATGFDCVAGLDPSTQHIYIAIRRGPMKVPTLGTQVYNGVTRTGTGSAATVTGAGFPPDLVILESLLDPKGSFSDRLRWPTQLLNSYETAAEATDTNGVTSFSMDGMSVGVGNAANRSGFDYVYWFLRRYPSVFDEVCYTGTSVSQTINHNLGVAPELMIIKSRNTATTDWDVLSNFTVSNFKDTLLNMANSGTNQTYGPGGSPNFEMMTAQPSSSAFFVSASAQLNYSARTFVAYLFATCAGVSKVGSYTGNGTTQTINCGFTGGARFVLIKRTDATGDWYVYDTARGMTVLTDPYLRLNVNSAETATLGSVTTVSTGFALNSTILAAINVNGGTYIFLAIA